MGLGTVASGWDSVAMGTYSIASGNYSLAAGSYAQANHQGSFVWSDSSSTTPFASTADNQFLIRATGGVGINTTNYNGGSLTVAGTTRLEDVYVGRMVANDPISRSGQFTGARRRADSEGGRWRGRHSATENAIPDLVRTDRQRAYADGPGAGSGASHPRRLGGQASNFFPADRDQHHGEATDTGPVSQAEALRAMATLDGETLLFNCHISSQSVAPVVFPDHDGELADEFARTLFSVSSLLPPSLRELARAENLNLSPTTRGFAFNADLVELIRFLDIGTRSSNLR